MKKIYGILAVIMCGCILTGCGSTSTMTCTREQDFGKAKIVIKTVATFKSDSLTKEDIEISATFESDEMAKSYVENYKDKEGYKVEQKGTDVKVKYTKKVDAETKNAEENKKDVYKDYMSKAGNDCK